MDDKGTRYDRGKLKFKDKDKDVFVDDDKNNNHFVAIPILPCAIPITE